MDFPLHKPYKRLTGEMEAEVPEMFGDNMAPKNTRTYFFFVGVFSVVLSFQSFVRFSLGGSSCFLLSFLVRVTGRNDYLWRDAAYQRQ